MVNSSRYIEQRLCAVEEIVLGEGLQTLTEIKELLQQQAERIKQLEEDVKALKEAAPQKGND